MEQLRAAVIGLGIGRRHVEVLQNLPGVRVVAVAALDERVLRQVQQEYGVPEGLTDFRRAIARPDVDLVCICTPDAQHAEQALFALDSGKHVYCEKPLATCLEDAARLVAKVRETGLKLMVGHNYRFVPQFETLAALVKSGLIGPPFLSESNYVQDLYFMEGLGLEYWRLKDPQDFFLGGAVHNVDLLRWIVGEVQEVHAYTNHIMPFYPLDDNYVANLRFANGCIGRVALVLGARLKDKFRIDLSLYGPEGGLSAVMHRSEVIQNVEHLAGELPTVLPVQQADSHLRALTYFVDCICQDRQPELDVVEGAKAVAICLAIRQSAHKKKPVTVDYASLQ